MVKDEDNVFTRAGIFPVCLWRRLISIGWWQDETNGWTPLGQGSARMGDRLGTPGAAGMGLNTESA